MTIRMILAALFLTLGVFAALVSVLGLFRFRNVLARMHAAAIVDTLAVLGVVLGLLLLFGLSVVSIKLMLILIFLWLTSPVASHLIAKMELLTGYELDADEKTGERERVL